MTVSLRRAAPPAISMPGLLVSALMLASCASVSPTATPESATGAKAAPAVEVPANDALIATAWTQTAVEHDLIYREIFHDARRYVLQALRDPAWDALPHAERQAPFGDLKPAIILDVDETVLDNSPYQARLVLENREFDDASWAIWCKQAIARPLPGALEFTRFAAAHGIDIYYISNRAQDLDQATLANLRADGFPVASDEVFLGLGAFVKGCEQLGSNKGCRRRLIAKNHRILAQFGDQIGDFIDVIANTPKGRRAAVEPYLNWIGERWFVFPNVNYGSWQPALFDNDWTLPQQQRRKAMRNALHIK